MSKMTKYSSVLWHL